MIRKQTIWNRRQLVEDRGISWLEKPSANPWDPLSISISFWARPMVKLKISMRYRINSSYDVYLFEHGCMNDFFFFFFNLVMQIKFTMKKFFNQDRFHEAFRGDLKKSDTP